MLRTTMIGSIQLNKIMRDCELTHFVGEISSLIPIGRVLDRILEEFGTGVKIVYYSTKDPEKKEHIVSLQDEKFKETKTTYPSEFTIGHEHWIATDREGMVWGIFSSWESFDLARKRAILNAKSRNLQGEQIGRLETMTAAAYIMDYHAKQELNREYASRELQANIPTQDIEVEGIGKVPSVSTESLGYDLGGNI